MVHLYHRAYSVRVEKLFKLFVAGFEKTLKHKIK